MKKRFTILLAVIMAMTLCLSACGGNNQTEQNTQDGQAGTDAGTEEKITIRFLHQWAEENRLPYWESVVNAYMEQNPNVIVSVNSSSDLSGKNASAKL